MHKVNRHEINCSESTIDAANELVDDRPQILVLFDILPRRYCQLCKNDFADPFGMLAKEELERMQLLRDTLDIVQSVHADDDLNISKPLLKLGDPFPDALLFQVLSHNVNAKVQRSARMYDILQ